MRAPAGSFCKAGARLLRPTGRRSSPFVRRPRASIHRPQRPTLPSLCPPPRTPAFPWSWLRFLGPCMPPSTRARSPLRPAPSARARSPFRFLRFPRPAPPSSALPYRAPGRCARLPLRRPSFPVPFPDTARLHRKGKRCPHQCGAPRGIPARAAGLTRRGCGPGFRACVARFCGLPRARGAGGGATVAAAIKPACRAGGARVSAGMVGEIVRPACRARWAAGVRPRLPCLHRSILRPDARAGGAGGGATVAAGHKTGLQRGRGAGIRRNGRRNRQAGLPRAVGGGGRTLPHPTVFL